MLEDIRARLQDKRDQIKLREVLYAEQARAVGKQRHAARQAMQDYESVLHAAEVFWSVGGRNDGSVVLALDKAKLAGGFKLNSFLGKLANKASTPCSETTGVTFTSFYTAQRDHAHEAEAARDSTPASAVLVGFHHILKLPKFEFDAVLEEASATEPAVDCASSTKEKPMSKAEGGVDGKALTGSPHLRTGSAQAKETLLAAPEHEENPEVRALADKLRAQLAAGQKREEEAVAAEQAREKEQQASNEEKEDLEVRELTRMVEPVLLGDGVARKLLYLSEKQSRNFDFRDMQRVLYCLGIVKSMSSNLGNSAGPRLVIDLQLSFDTWGMSARMMTETRISHHAYSEVDEDTHWDVGHRVLKE